jgi:DNA helicase-2/ATP-dependent DNA helicase PcrA
LIAAAKAQKVSPMELCERIIDGDQLPAGIRPGIKKNLANFVGAVKKLRRAADKASALADERPFG